MSILFYFGIVVAAGYIFYVRVAAMNWNENERRQIARDQLHLGHLLQLLEDRDIRHMANNRHQRGPLFHGFSTFLLEDVQKLRTSVMGIAGLIWLGLFYLGYGMIRLKSFAGWGRNDLNFLAGLELGLIRSLRRD